MTHTYSVTGMTCAGCEAKVKSALLSIPHVISAELSKENKTAVIEMDKHIPLAAFQKALGSDAKYTITAQHNETAEQTKSWFNTYKPVLLIFAFILLVTLTVEFSGNGFLWPHWMNNFMAAFFLVFSFFKFLNLAAFAETYSMYDVIARRYKSWGYIYAFTELVLGILFLTGYQPLLANAIAFVVMAVSITGVLESVLNKRKIQCACLGAIFNLPMSNITILEDALMIAMSGTMIVTILN